MDAEKRNEGLSEVVGFMLILGLLVIAAAAYQVYEVPSIGRNNEIEHMNYVKDRFVDYKISVDSLWINSMKTEDNEYDPVTGVTLSTSVNLGAGGGMVSGGGDVMPILTPIPSAGSVMVDGSHGTLNIHAEFDSGPDIDRSIALGILEYSSDNNYWVNQRYFYQMGGVFLRQDEGGIAVRVDPPLSIYNSGDTVAVQITPINLTGAQVVGGSGPVNIDTRLRDSGEDPDFTETLDATEMYLEFVCDDSEEADAWDRIIRSVLQREGIDSGWYEITYPDAKTVRVKVEDPDGNFNIKLDVFIADYYVTLQNVATSIT